MAASLIKEAKQTTCLRFNIERDLDLKLLLFNSGYYDALLLKPAPWKLAPWLRYCLNREYVNLNPVSFDLGDHP